MKNIWGWITGIMAAGGGLLAFGAVGTSDYYVIELGQEEPEGLWVRMVIGFALMVPFIARAIYKEWKEEREYEYYED